MRKGSALWAGFGVRRRGAVGARAQPDGLENGCHLA